MILWSYTLDGTMDHLVDLTYDYRRNLLLDQVPVQTIQHLPTGLTALTVTSAVIYVLTSDYHSALSADYAQG